MDLPRRAVAIVRRARRRARADERGFSVVETMVAISVLATVLVAAGGGFVTSVKRVHYARQNQHATEVLAEHIEALRGTGYSAVAHVSTDLTADPAVSGPDTNGRYWVDPDQDGPLAGEPVIVATGGAVNPHITTEVRNGVTYTVTRYVTDPQDATATRLRRVSVIVSWDRVDSTIVRRASTFVTLTRRGLPLPNFTFGSPTSFTANQGTTLVLPFTLVNRGARDSWNLSATAAGRTWSFTWYKDASPLGTYGPEDNVVFSDNDADGRKDTGELATDQESWGWAVMDIPATEATGVVAVTMKAQSISLPSSATGTRYFDHSVEVVSQNCAGCTWRQHWLRNANNNNSTTARTNMPVELTSPTGELGNWDTNRDTAAGRWLSPGGSGATEASTDLMANWRYSLGSDTSFGDTATVTLYVAMKDYAAGTTGTVNVHIRGETSNNTYTTFGSASATVGPYTDGTTWHPVSVTVPLAQPFSIARNKKVELKVTSSSGEIWLAYSSVSHPASFTLAVLS